MKITIPAAEFADAATFARKAIDDKPRQPSLSGMLIEAIQGTLALSGFDYEKSARVSTAADIDEPGRALLPGRMLVDILKKLRGTVTLEITDRRATITSGKSKYTLATMNINDYPALPEMPAKVGEVDGDLFAEAVSQVVHAASKDSKLPIFTCVKVTTEGNWLTMHATDKYRMAERRIQWAPTETDSNHSWLLKADSLSNAARMGAGALTLLASDGIVGFRSGNLVTTTALSDGQYPDVGKLFPTDCPINVTVNRDALAEAVGRTSLVAEQRTPVRLIIADGEIQLDAGTGEDATGLEFVDCELNGDPITTAFNPVYLEQGLRTLSTDTVNIALIDGKRPAVITPDDDTDHRLLMMPIRLKDGN